ncbi:MAG: nitrophenyl compound nitroreductase subunit ArsF family protein, partial [Candidatus Bipolaricaulota bacterium]
MKLAKSVLTILLLLFVGATVGTLIAQEVTRPNTQDAEIGESALPVEASETVNREPDPGLDESVRVGEPEPSEIDASNGIGEAEGSGESPVLAFPSTDAPCAIEAIYFHNTNRCVTCLKIEGDAKAIVEAGFAEELAAGKLQWSAINMEDERAYVSQYDLVSPSLVLIRKVGDEVVDWTTLTETWALVRSATRFA